VGGRGNEALSQRTETFWTSFIEFCTKFDRLSRETLWSPSVISPSGVLALVWEMWWWFVYDCRGSLTSAMAFIIFRMDPMAHNSAEQSRIQYR
jgi:hypothetical protein